MIRKFFGLLILWHSLKSVRGDSHPLVKGDVGVSAELLEYTHVALNLTKLYISSHTNALVIMEKCSGLVCRRQTLNHDFLLEYFLRNLSCDISVQLEFGRPDVRPWDYNLFVIDSAKAFE